MCLHVLVDNILTGVRAGLKQRARLLAWQNPADERYTIAQFVAISPQCNEGVAN